MPPALAVPSPDKSDHRWRETNEIAASEFARAAVDCDISLARAQRNPQAAAGAATPYWAQGDASMHSDKNAEKRRRLRYHAGVIEALEQWWSTAVRCAPPKPGEPPTIQRTCFEELNIKIYKAMIEEWDLTAAKASARSDWEKDCGQRPLMTDSMFQDAIFELADLWAYDIDGEEYAMLLWQLFGCVTKGPTPDESVWKPLDEITLMRRDSAERYGRFGATLPQKKQRGKARSPRQPVSVRTMTPPKPSPRVRVPKAPLPPVSPRATAAAGDPQMMRQQGRRRLFGVAVGTGSSSNWPESPRGGGVGISAPLPTIVPTGAPAARHTTLPKVPPLGRFARKNMPSPNTHRRHGFVARRRAGSSLVRHRRRTGA